MPTNEPRNFDLNIEKILEGWEVRHAIREVIANALDEQVLSNTEDITLSADRSGNWHVRDFGRGIRYENLTQNENPGGAWACITTAGLSLSTTRSTAEA
jgi:DNA gyrase/topoisomerase IV subunit B